MKITLIFKIISLQENRIIKYIKNKQKEKKTKPNRIRSKTNIPNKKKKKEIILAKINKRYESVKNYHTNSTIRQELNIHFANSIFIFLTLQHNTKV